MFEDEYREMKVVQIVIYLFLIYYFHYLRGGGLNWSRLSVCLSICLFVSTLRSKAFNIQSQNLVQGLTSGDDIFDKFDCQGHRSKVKVTGSRNVFSRVSDLSEQILNPDL